MARSRDNAVSNDAVDLYNFFYKFSDLKEPSAIGSVLITDQYSNLMATIPASDIIDLGSGIRKIRYTVPASAVNGVYNDTWTGIIEDPGDDVESVTHEFIVRGAVWQELESLHVNDYRIRAELENPSFKLYEKKWVKFNIKDSNNLLKNTDTVDILLKDRGGTSVFLSSATINERLGAFYYFNSSQLQDWYPTLITREETYEWILKIEYNNTVILPDPVEFKFSAV